MKLAAWIAKHAKDADKECAWLILRGVEVVHELPSTATEVQAAGVMDHLAIEKYKHETLVLFRFVTWQQHSGIESSGIIDQMIEQWKREKVAS